MKGKDEKTARSTTAWSTTASPMPASPMTGSAMTLPPALALHGVSLQRRGRVIVDAIDLALPATGAIALVGPNGAGKSTLLSLLAGLLTPDRGAVSVRGRDLASLTVAERARHLGYLPQRFEPHWDLSVAELIRIRLAQAPWVNTACLTAAGLAAFATHRWSTLSGGERARVLLAVVLATEPPILLADEPGAALDVRHRLELVRALARRGRDHLVLVVMHDLDLAFQFFERVLVMDAGRLVLDGGPELALSPQLDRHFRVRFERIGAPPGQSLRAHLPDDAETGHAD